MAELCGGSKKKLLSEVGGRCFYCGMNLIPENTTFDHIVPKSKMGRGTIKNLCACCYGCNGTKRVYSVEEFRDIMERSLQVPHYEFHFERLGLSKGESYV